MTNIINLISFFKHMLLIVKKNANKIFCLNKIALNFNSSVTMTFIELNNHHHHYHDNKT